MQQNKKPLKPSLYKLMYLFGRIKKPKVKPLPRMLSDKEWKEIIDACKTVNIEI